MERKKEKESKERILINMGRRANRMRKTKVKRIQRIENKKN